VALHVAGAKKVIRLGDPEVKHISTVAGYAILSDIARDVLLLAIAEGPHFVDLNPLALQISECTVLILSAELAALNQ
jgi:hypothetical protein